MLIVTSESIAGKRIVRTLGLVKGSTVRARHIGHDIIAGLKNLVGGEIREYGKLVAEAREQSLDRMMDDARAMDANAVIAVRFSTTVMMDGAAEMLAYGTAVVFEDT